MTDEAFAELLLAPPTGTHSMETAGNQQELRHLQAALHSYRRETLHWAERRSAGQPSLADKARAQQRWAALPQWALATVALVTIVGGVVHLASDPDRAGEPDNVAVTVPAGEQPAAAEDLAADNHLLSSIDAELSYHGGSPVDELRLQDSRATERIEAFGATD